MQDVAAPILTVACVEVHHSSHDPRVEVMFMTVTDEAHLVSSSLFPDCN